MRERATNFKLTVGCLAWLCVASSCTITTPPADNEPAPAVAEAKPEPPFEAPRSTVDDARPQAPPTPEIAQILEPTSGGMTIAIISDMNSSYGSTDYTSHLRDTITWLCNGVRPDLVLGTGDMVAGMKPGLNYPAMWAAFHQTVTDRLNKCGLTFVPTAGNHDGAAAAGFKGEREEYVRQWTPRKPKLDWISQDRWPLWFSFEFGPPGARTRFVGLDLTVPSAMSPDDLAWVGEQLNTTLPTVVFGHVPIVPIAREREREASYDDALQNLLVAHGSWFIHGHHHVYYPHKYGGLSTISMPNLGTGARAWVGTNDVGGQGAVLLRVEAGKISWKAYRASSFDFWPVSELPLRLDVGGRNLERWNP